jgi:hypothetical protein
MINPKPVRLLLCKERTEYGECGVRAHRICEKRKYPVCYFHSMDEIDHQWSEGVVTRFVAWARIGWRERR